MESFPGFEFIIIFVLILANGFFAASEIAIVSARRSRLQQQVDAGDKRAKQALNLAENPDSFLATVQIGITLISTIAAAFGGASISDYVARWLKTFPLIAPYASSIAFGTVVMLITYLSLVVGELAPKRIALQSAEGIALLVAPFMQGLSLVARPVVALLTFSANIILRLLGRERTAKEVITAEDIVYLAREGAVSGTVETEQQEFINRVFRITDQTVSSVMMPRTDIVAVADNTPFNDVIETFMSSGYTRLPLYEGTLDNIVGVLYAKDLLRARPEAQKNQPFDLRTVARPAFFIPAYQHVNDLLKTFRNKGIHMAIVIDEYSQVIGLVTLEDVLEELVGEIQDEYDEPEDQNIVQREDGSWLVDAMTDHEKVRTQIGMSHHSGDVEKARYNTLAGMLLAHLGHIPKEGDTVTIDNFTFEIIDMDGKRIDKVLIKPVDEAPAPVEEGGVFHG